MVLRYANSNSPDLRDTFRSKRQLRAYTSGTMDKQHAQIVQLYANEYYEGLRRSYMWALMDCGDTEEDLEFLTLRVRQLKRQFWAVFNVLTILGDESEARAERITELFDRHMPYHDPWVLLRLRLDIGTFLKRIDEIRELRNEAYLVVAQPMSKKEMLIARISYICFGITLCTKLKRSELYQRLRTWMYTN